MAITHQLGRPHSPELHIPEPVFVFFKLTNEMEALPAGFADEFARKFGADVHSEVRTGEKLEEELGAPKGKGAVRERIREIHREIGGRMVDSITSGRNVFIDAHLQTPRVREPYITGLHALGAEAVAVNVRIPSTKLKNIRQARLNTDQLRAAEAMKRAPFKKGLKSEEFDHILTIEDHLETKKLLRMIALGIERSRAVQARDSNQPYVPIARFQRVIDKKA